MTEIMVKTNKIKNNRIKIIYYIILLLITLTTLISLIFYILYWLLQSEYIILTLLWLPLLGIFTGLFIYWRLIYLIRYYRLFIDGVIIKIEGMKRNPNMEQFINHFLKDFPSFSEIDTQV